MNRISPTLLDSFGYYMSIEDDERSAVVRGELLARLRREEREPSAAMQKGLDFEAHVVRALKNEYLTSGDLKYDACVQEVADFVEGGLHQVHIQAEVNGVLVHGYIDFLCGNLIVDVKTTKKYTMGKYYSGNQHLVYMYALRPAKITSFSYLVTDFRNVYREDYSWNPKMLDQIKSNLADWFGYLENDPEMREAYETTYQQVKAGVTD